jgi:hypothetical protein
MSEPFFVALLQVINEDESLDKKDKQAWLLKLQTAFERSKKRGTLQRFFKKLQESADLEAYLPLAAERISTMDTAGDVGEAPAPSPAPEEVLHPKLKVRATRRARLPREAEAPPAAQENENEALRRAIAESLSMMEGEPSGMGETAASGWGASAAPALAEAAAPAGEAAAEALDQGQSQRLGPAAPALAEENDGLRPVIPVSKGVANDGNCFYSSIYWAITKNEPLKAAVAGCLGVDVTRESEFIRTMRAAVQLKIEEDYLPSEGGEDVYDTLKYVFDSKEGWQGVLDSYPDWFGEAFPEDPYRGDEFPDRDTFRDRFAAGAGTNQNWVSEIEVTIVKNALAECGIPLVIYNEEVARADPNAINLLNQGEAHFIYFSFNTPEGYENSLRYLQRSLEECQRKCRGIEQRIRSLQAAKPVRATLRRRGGGRMTRRKGHKGKGRRGSRKQK